MMLQTLNNVSPEVVNNRNIVKKNPLSEFFKERVVPTNVGETVNEQFKKYIKLQNEKNN